MVKTTFQLNKRLVKNGSPIRLIAVVALLLALIVLILELTNTTFLFHERKAVSGTIPSTVVTQSPEEEEENNKPETPAPSQTDKATGQANSTSSQPIDKNTAPQQTSGAGPIAPSGNFVSNHKPSLKNSPDMESVCITTPGATCKITITKGGVTKDLEVKKADSNGTVIWYWNLNTAGFVEGSWSVSATSSLNGHTKTTTDIQKLEVQQ